LAARDPSTPWYAKLIALVTAAYALSPIDLIPDFIPVLGYLDDVVLVPLGIQLAIRLIPSELIQEYRSMAALALRRPVSYVGACLVMLIWLTSAIMVAYFLIPERSANAHASFGKQVNELSYLSVIPH